MCDFLLTILTVYLTIPFSQIVLDIKRPVSYVQEQKPLLSCYIALGDWGKCEICHLKFGSVWSSLLFMYFHKYLSQWEYNETNSQVIYYTYAPQKSAHGACSIAWILHWDLIVLKVLRKKKLPYLPQMHWNGMLLYFLCSTQSKWLQ